MNISSDQPTSSTAQSGPLAAERRLGSLDQHARIQAAAIQLQQKRRQQEQEEQYNTRSGRSDMDDYSQKTSSVFNLQPVIMKVASPAMENANTYDKEELSKPREAYLATATHGRGLANETRQRKGHAKSGSSTSNLDSLQDSLDISNMTDNRTQPTKSPALLEAINISSIDNRIEQHEPGLTLEPASTFSTEIAAVVKRGQSIEETGDKGSRDSPTALRSRLFTFRGGRRKIRRKLVIVGDAACGKTALFLWVVPNQSRRSCQADLNSVFSGRTLPVWPVRAAPLTLHHHFC
jgi:hypothetical protein